jgi:hypothetical protein
MISIHISYIGGEIAINEELKIFHNIHFWLFSTIT